MDPLLNNNTRNSKKRGTAKIGRASSKGGNRKRHRSGAVVADPLPRAVASSAQGEGGAEEEDDGEPLLHDAGSVASSSKFVCHQSSA